MPEAASPQAIATDWLGGFEAAISNGDFNSAMQELFVEDCWWRDLLTLTWDIQTFRGRAGAETLLSTTPSDQFPRDFALQDERAQFVELAGRRVLGALFTFRTDIAWGRGVLRLVEDDGRWRAWLLLTSMRDLIGLEEKTTSIVDVSMEAYNTAVRGRETWYQRREREREFADADPAVLIVGAGHSGVMLAARLRHLGVSHLIVDKEERLGDNWRQRYSGLSLHDTCWYSRFPYLEYPDNWPLFSPAELLGDWIESYVDMLQLNAWVRSEVTRARYDDVDQRWDVTIVRGGQVRQLRPAHVVFATGLAGKPRMPSIPKQEEFTGEVMHSQAFKGGQSYTGKRAVVVGAGASGHDVAQSLWEAGAAQVTMVQRGASYVMSAEKGIPIFHGRLWTENGPALDVADLLSVSFPWEFQLNEIAPATTELIAEQDAELLAGLERIGFSTSLGRGHQGMSGIVLNAQGGYYIDKGCSQLLIDGEIRLQRGEIAEFTPDGVVYSDGTSAEADVVVFCTGWDDTREMARPIVGDEVLESVHPVWGLDPDGELYGSFRQSGFPHLWFVVGSTGLVRAFSKYVALQILAAEHKLLPPRPPAHQTEAGSTALGRSLEHQEA